MKGTAGIKTKGGGGKNRPSYLQSLDYKRISKGDVASKRKKEATRQSPLKTRLYLGSKGKKNEAQESRGEEGKEKSTFSCRKGEQGDPALWVGIS